MPSTLQHQLRRWKGRARQAGIATLRRLPPTVRRPLTRLARHVDQRGVTFRVPTATPSRWHTDTHPDVTVVVTSKDRSELLAIALRSVQMQDLTELECIVIDDDSTDDAVQVAQSFVAADPRFRILAHDVSRGASAARNAALAAARGTYVCFLDDDDFLLAGSLRARRDSLVGHPVDVVGSYCDWINIEPGVGLDAFVPRRRPRRRAPVSWASLSDGAPFILSAPLLKSAVVRSVGGFDERLTRAEDVDLWFRLARLGFRFVGADHVGVAYRRTPASVVTSEPAAQLAALLDVFDRADQPDPSVAGHGPFPSPEPLSMVAISNSRRVQVLRYVALASVDAPDRAEAAARRSLHPAVLRTVDIDAELPELCHHAATRLALDAPRTAALQASLREVLGRLAPTIDEPWQPLVDAAAWSKAILEQVRPIGPRPGIASGDIRTLIDGAVVLIPEARYHVDELGPLADELRRREVSVRFMISPKTVPAALDELGRYTHEVVPYAPDDIAVAKALVTLNDWGPLKQLVQLADDAGVPTFGKVEGVQDFDDIESSWERTPYRTVSFVLAQGDNDVTALPGKETLVVGSTRLERLWRSSPVHPGDHALVNVNFTFGVLSDRRHEWVTSVQRSLARAGVAGVVSTHPAERAAVHDLPIAVKPFRHEITKAGVLISRFSTVPFEAMARGVPFVYHNPHGERFPAFANPAGAFCVSASDDELTAALTEALAWRVDYRRRCSSFFARQISIDPTRTSAERAADAVVKLSA